MFPFLKKTDPRIRKMRKAGVIIPDSTRIYDNVRIDMPYGGSVRIGENCELLDGVLILTYGGNIRIGNNCSINPYTVMYGHGGLTVGNDVLIAGGCMIIPGNHRYSRRDIPIREQGTENKGIVIEDDVWIAHGCTILDGVTIGRGSVIAAGSVVRESTEPFSINAGIPARFIKHRGA
jgi:acetyltransferase-like isoleucine patch superfamily enzyme